jgi:ribosomal protein S18 acetylase RimI-like enzyme
MSAPAFEIRRPREDEWPQMLAVLESANFHRIGGKEMPAFPLSDCFVAVADGRVVGVGGYRVLDATTAKTTLLAVLPAYRGRAVGAALQQTRQDHLARQGIRRLYTNVDDERAVAWYTRRFGYKPTGKRTPKVEPFGRDDRREWINLMVEL